MVVYTVMQHTNKIKLNINIKSFNVFIPLHYVQDYITLTYEIKSELSYLNNKIHVK